MADSASESDSSSIDGGPIMMPPSPVTREQLYKRIESLQQQNRVYKVELETYKLRVKALQEENKHLRQTSVNIQAKAEQEEEFISNTLLKKIQALKKEKETLAHHYEQEEECLTNDLSRKLNQLQAEKCKLEQTLEEEQECLVNKLMRKIVKLEAETVAKQNNLEQLRREKVELENTLEQEQEALVNRLWKRMDKLEAEKRNLQNKAQAGFGNRSGAEGEPGSALFLRTEPSSTGLNILQRDIPGSGGTSSLASDRRGTDSNDNSKGLVNAGTANNEARAAALDQDVIALSGNVQHLRNEVDRLKAQLSIAQKQHADNMAQFAMEEQQIRDENLRLQRRLQLEMERRESLCRHLSESESSLEMEDERHFHESLVAQGSPAPLNVSNSSVSGIGGNTSMANLASAATGPLSSISPAAMSASNSSSSVAIPSNARPRPVSSPGPFAPSPGSGSRPMSPGLQLMCNTSNRDVMMSPPSPVNRCLMCNGNGFVLGGGCSGGPLVVTTSQTPGHFANAVSSSSPPIHNSSRERFARPAPPSSDRPQDPRTPGDSTMSSPAPSPAPLEVAMSPNATVPSQSPSPMDTSRT